MVKSARLFGKQYLGFWFPALIFVLLQLLPYIVMMFVRPEPNPIKELPESSRFMEACEKLCGILCVVVLTFIVHKDAGLFSLKTARETVFFALAMIVLAANYIGWILYYNGHQSAYDILILLVTLPPLYYMFLGVWRRNTPLIICASVFLPVHFFNVLTSLHATFM